MEFKAFGITDVGLKRERNEDSFSVEDNLGLFVVADGMGGHLAGEVASKVAVEMITKSYRKWVEKETPEEELFSAPDKSLSREGNYILSGIRLANRVIYEMALENEQYHGMGTTVVVLLVKPGLIIAANVGDSRIYQVLEDRIERLSKDHTIVSEQIEMGMMTEEEAASSPLKHILTRNLGSSENVDPEIFELIPSDHDRFILCSDGLTDMVRDDEILRMSAEAEEPESLCRTLLDLVLKRGANDNTTIVAVFLSGKKKSKQRGLSTLGLFFADCIFGLQRFAKKIIP